VGDPPFTGARVGPDGQLYQLRTSPTSGVDIARYSLTPAKAAPPTPAANPAAAHPTTSRWLLPSLAALGASLLAGLSIWLLYRHRQPAGLDRRQPFRAGR
jgi:hypothetical protein